MNDTQTIAAIATPIGSAGIGVIRISGLHTFEVASRIFGQGKVNVPDLPSHTAHYGSIADPGTGEHIDNVVLTLFRAPASYTGEDVVEISCHGGMSVLKSALNAVLDSGARLAEPGEFTKRAFLNGKLDLTQAEAVNDLIRASTDGARKVALRQLDGALSSRVQAINMRILGVIAAIEAAIDFPEDVEEPDIGWVSVEIDESRQEVEDLLASSDAGRIYREGLRVVLAGRVNVGKSSLLNALLRNARAIVTPIPGTTRDVIEESVQIRGIPVVAIDTAGLRATDDVVERIGVELSERHIESADIVLLIIDASEGLSDEDIALASRLQDRPVILVLNKIDLLPDDARRKLADDCIKKLEKSIPVVSTSAASNWGIDDLEDSIAKLAGTTEMGTESVVVSNVRHQRSLRSASGSLKQVLATIENHQPIDFLSVDLIAARNALGLITGETAEEDLLDRIFSEFCIGK